MFWENWVSTQKIHPASEWIFLRFNKSELEQVQLVQVGELALFIILSLVKVAQQPCPFVSLSLGSGQLKYYALSIMFRGNHPASLITD